MTTETLGGVDDDRPAEPGGLRPRRAGLLRRPGTRPTRRSRTGHHRAPTSRSRGRSRRGAGDQACSPPRPRTRAATSTGAPSSTAMSKITDFPGSLSPVLQLRAGQALRAHPVPGRPDPQQRAALLTVQDARRTTSRRARAGSGAALQAVAIDFRILRGRPREGGRPAGNRGTTRPPHVLTSLAQRRRSGRLESCCAQPWSSTRSSRLPDVVALRPRVTDDAQAMLVGDGGRPCRMSWVRVSIASFSSGCVRM